MPNSQARFGNNNAIIPLSANNEMGDDSPSKYQAVKDFVKRVPLLYKTLRFPFVAVRYIKQNSRARKKGLGLKIVARY